MSRKRFCHFKEDRFDISDTPRSGRTSGFHEDRLNTLIPNNPRQCTQELATVIFYHCLTFVTLDVREDLRGLMKII